MKKLFTMCVLLCSVLAVKAQWNSNTDENMKVVDHSISITQSQRMSDGKTYVVYWQSDPAIPTGYKLRMQILDQSGNRQLGPYGALITDQIMMNGSVELIKTTIDASNNLYVAVNGTGGNHDSYIFKITPQGNSVWPNGISVGQGDQLSILHLSNDDILVAYKPTNETYLKIKRFNSNGQAMWSSPVALLSDDPTKQTVASSLFELTNNEFEVVFHKIINSAGDTYLFAQKLDLNGTIMWSTPKQISTKTTAMFTKYGGVADGNVVYYGITGSSGSGFADYLQRINADGTLPWGADGADFDINQTNLEMDMKIAHTPGSPNIWAIANYSNSSQTAYGEYVQKFDKNTGARLFTDNAKQVFPINASSMMHTGNLYLVNDKPYFVVQKNMPPSMFNISLHAVMLNDNGDFAWPQQYLPLATFAALKSYVSSLPPVNGQSVIVFNEQKNFDSDKFAYAQNLVLPTLGTSEVNGNHQNINIYPNPVADVITVKGVKDQKFNIYNLAGQVVKRGEMKENKINVQDLSKGAYILKIGDQNERYKLIKK